MKDKNTKLIFRSNNSIKSAGIAVLFMPVVVYMICIDFDIINYYYFLLIILELFFIIYFFDKIYTIQITDSGIYIRYLLKPNRRLIVIENDIIVETILYNSVMRTSTDYLFVKYKTENQYFYSQFILGSLNKRERENLLNHFKSKDIHIEFTNVSKRIKEYKKGIKVGNTLT